MRTLVVGREGSCCSACPDIVPSRLFAVGGQPEAHGALTCGGDSPVVLASNVSPSAS